MRLSKFVVCFVIFGTSLSGFLFVSPASGATQPAGPIVFLDPAGNVVTGLNFSVNYDAPSRSVKISITSESHLWMLANRSWIESLIPQLALENLSFSSFGWSSQNWYKVELAAGTTLVHFHPS